MQRDAKNRASVLLIFFQILLTMKQLAIPSAFSVETDFVSHNSSRRSQLQLFVKDHKHVVMDNGIIEATLSVPDGFITAIHYNGSDNILDASKNEDDRGYWDMNWNIPGSQNQHSLISSTKYEVIRQDHDQIELSFSSTWVSSNHSNPPINVDKRFVMLPDKYGLYTYGIFKRPKGWPDLDVSEARIVFKLNKYKFRYMAISDGRQRIMPYYIDRLSGQPLAYPEAVLLKKVVDLAMRGEVDDKYQYSCENMDNRVHGWISFSPSLGFWMITPSNEFRNGGPFKQELTSHCGPFTLSMFQSQHYAGNAAALHFRNGEPWTKVFGPVFIHLNSKPFDSNPVTLWIDAKAQMLKEIQYWPYSFPLSKDFAQASERGRITGQLHICDKYIQKSCFPAAWAHLGLAAPGTAGSWQTESKGYQFWSQTDGRGYFLIKGILPGEYNLYGWVPGVLGDFKHATILTIKSGSAINLGNVVYTPPRYGPTLWEIGIPDRTAAEFFIPDPNPKLVNRLYMKQDKFRQYGLWQRYAELYPNRDLVYTIGQNDYTKDWFFAQVTRSVGKDQFIPTTWQIVFYLVTVYPTQKYVLQLALASSTASYLLVNINEMGSGRPAFESPVDGHDNAIARHGIHGLYSLFSINISGSQFSIGRNTIYLTQSKSATRFEGIMYDYIRLEGPLP